MHDAQSVVVEHKHTGHRAAGLKQFESDVTAPDVQQRRSMIECPLHLSTRRVATGVDDSTPRVPTLSGERPLSGRCLVEGKDEVDVDPETARLARASVQRMIEIGAPGGGE